MALSAGNLNQGNATNPMGNPLGELPPLPPPSSLVMNGPIDVIVPKGMPGQPANGPVIIRPAGQTGQSIYGSIPSTQIPTSSIYTPPSLPGSADIPAPHLAAPWMFHNGSNLQQSAQQGAPYGTAPYGMNSPNQFNNNQNTFYNTYGQPQQAYPYMMPQQAYPQAPVQQQPQPPAQPPAPQPEAPKAPEPPKPEEPKKEEPKAEEKPKEEPKKPDAGSFNEDVIKRLNDMLNNANESVRADAAIDFFKILSGNPSLAEDPLYKKYVDAFLTKILQDPSAVVRQGGMLAMETGLVKQPNSKVRGVLEDLSKRSGLFDIESSAAQDILGSILPEAPQIEDTHGHNNNRSGNLRKANPHFGNPAKAPTDSATSATEHPTTNTTANPAAEGVTPAAPASETAITEANQEAAQATPAAGDMLNNPNLPQLSPDIMAQLAQLGGGNTGFPGAQPSASPQAPMTTFPSAQQPSGQRLNMVSPSGTPSPQSNMGIPSMQRPGNFPMTGGQRYA